LNKQTKQDTFDDELFNNNAIINQFGIDPFSNNIDPFETVQFIQPDTFFLPAGFGSSNDTNNNEETSFNASDNPQQQQQQQYKHLTKFNERNEQDEETQSFLTKVNAHILTSKALLLNTQNLQSSNLNSSFYLKSNRNLLCLEGKFI